MIILIKDTHFIIKMRQILKQIIENPSESCIVHSAISQANSDWKSVFAQTINLINTESFSFKAQIKHFFYKFHKI